MRNQDKAEKYDNLIARGDALQRKISALKATGGGINLTEAVTKEIAVLEQQKVALHAELQELFRDEY